MKQFQITKQGYVLGLVIMFLLAATHLYAFGTTDTGYRVDKSTTVIIDAWDECREVVNSSGYDHFVPTKTAEMWQSFRDNLPAGVVINTCCVSGSETFTTSGEDSFDIDAGKKDCRFRITVKGAGGSSNSYYSGGIGGGSQFTYSPATTGTFGVYVGGRGTSDGNASLGGGGGGGGSGGGGGGASAIKFGSTVLAVSGGGGGVGSGSKTSSGMRGAGGNGGSLNAPGDDADGYDPFNVYVKGIGRGGQNTVAEGSKDGGNGSAGNPGGISVPDYKISGGGGAGSGALGSGGGGGGGYGGGGGGTNSPGAGGASYALYAYMDINSFINGYISFKNSGRTNGNDSGRRGGGHPVWPPPGSAPGSLRYGSGSRGRWGATRDEDNDGYASDRNGGSANGYSSGSNNHLLLVRPFPTGGGGGGGGGYMNTGMGLTSESAVFGSGPDTNGEVKIEWFK